MEGTNKKELEGKLTVSMVASGIVVRMVLLVHLWLFFFHLQISSGLN